MNKSVQYTPNCHTKSTFFSFQHFNCFPECIVIFVNLSEIFVSFFGLVAFYGILTILGYLMPNPFYTYILNMICKHIF